VVVDAISQKPTGTKRTQWPQDNDTDRVCGVLERFDPQAKSVTAYCDNTYPDIRLRRALQLLDHTAVDDFTATDAKGAEHQYDYVLHIDGKYEICTAPLEPASGRLGDRCGYELVELKHRGTVNGAFTLTFTNGDRQLRLWVPAEAATDVIVADGLTSSPDRKMAMVVLRRKAAQARFLTVLEPVKPEDPIRAVSFDDHYLVIEGSSGTRRTAIR
jgi:hypothetical protein